MKLTLTPEERECIVLDQELGPVLITKQTVQDPLTGRALVGKKVILSKGISGDSVPIQAKEGTILVGSEQVSEAEIIPSERERIRYDPKLGPVLVSKKKAFNPKRGSVFTGKRVVREERMTETEAKGSNLGVERGIKPSIIKTDKGHVLVGEEVVCESEVESNARVVVDPNIGPVLVTKQTVPHENWGRVLVGKRVVAGQRRRSSSLKYLERVKLSAEFSDPLKLGGKNIEIQSPCSVLHRV